jgi:hypothetical protein
MSNHILSTAKAREGMGNYHVLTHILISHQSKKPITVTVHSGHQSGG